MNQLHSKHLALTKSLITVAVIVLIGMLMWWYFSDTSYLRKYRSPKAPVPAEVSYTPHKGGVLVPPAGFPVDVPYVKGALTASSQTVIGGGEATQRYIAFVSSKKVDEEFKIYKDYLNKTNYTVTEGDSGLAKALHGRKRNATLDVVLSVVEEGTLVQITHLTFDK